MRKLILILLVSCVALIESNAQDNYSKFRGEVGLTGGILMGKMSGGGFGGYTEFKYNVTDNISAGVRAAADVLIGGNYTGDASNLSVGTKLAASLLAKGEYYFTTTKVRPYAGFGLGLYSTGSSSASSDGNVATSAGNHFGMMPQLGVNFGSFRMGLQYNIITGKDLVTVAVGQTEEISNNWLGFDIGVTIGGKSK